MSDKLRMVEVVQKNGRRMTVNPRLVAGVKELEPRDGKESGLTLLMLGIRGAYPVRGTYDEVHALLWPKPIAETETETA